MNTPNPQTIELDCPPGNPRPGDLLPSVIKDTGIPEDNREPVSKLFGNWEWNYDDVPEEIWLKARPTIKKRIERLFKGGIIRYASW